MERIGNQMERPVPPAENNGIEPRGRDRREEYRDRGYLNAYDPQRQERLVLDRSRPISDRSHSQPQGQNSNTTSPPALSQQNQPHQHQIGDPTLNIDTTGAVQMPTRTQFPDINNANKLNKFFNSFGAVQMPKKVPVFTDMNKRYYFGV
eukprot:UN34097